MGNLKPKLKWFFKPKLKPKNFLLNWHPAAGVGGEGSVAAHGEEADPAAEAAVPARQGGLACLDDFQGVQKGTN